jgi:(p)ppGpp synthase/HD superfamily hydrolase
MNVAALDQTKIVNVEWNVSPALVKGLYVYVEDEFGLVKKVLDTLIDAGVSVLSINMKPHKSSVAIILKVKSDKEDLLKEMEHKLSKMPRVMSVRLGEA